MALEELLQTIDDVRGRIQSFRGELQKSEALTRYALIDPILRALGWNTADPENVRPEFLTGTGRPDYALLLHGKPLVMVEAKALGEDLDAAKDKGFQYCWKNKVSYYVVTDGDMWEVHDLREMGGKTVLRVSLAEGSPGEVARSLLALWRPAMPALEAPLPSVALAAQTPPNVLPTPPGNTAVSAAAVLDLVELDKALRRGGPLRRSPPPLKVMLPDGQERAVQSWRDLLLHVVAWSGPKLKHQLPVTLTRTGTVIVGREPTGMRAPKKVDSMWVETHASAHGLVRFACLTLRKIGYDPALVRVVLPQ